MQYEKSKRASLEQIHVFSGQEFYRFDKYLADKTNTRLEPLYQLRLQEIDQMLNKYDVKSVREMGAGRTTFFFNLYPGLDVVSYEQDEYWRDVLLSFYKESGSSPPPRSCVAMSNVTRTVGVLSRFTIRGVTCFTLTGHT